jgi:diguanylate cyclase (GGDEF)-like protein
MRETKGKTLPFRTTTATVILLLSLPFVVLSWLLASAIIKHERQFAAAEQVLELFRTGLDALAPLEEMRSLSRPIHGSSEQPEITARFAAADQKAQQELQRLFALTRHYAAHTPAVAKPLQRLEESVPTLQDAGSGAIEVMGPFNVITRYMDDTYGLLATVLYASDLPEGEKAQSAEMLLLIPDTLRLVHSELGIIHTLTFPTLVNLNGLSTADITTINQAFDNLDVQLDTLGSQLQGIKQRSPILRTSPDHLEAVHTYLDRIEQDYILTFTPWSWERADREGRLAHAALNIVTHALLDTTDANLQKTRTRQRQIDIASACALLLLYAVLVYFSFLFFRARDAAQHAREMAKEITERKRRESELRQLNQLSELLMACRSCAEAYEVFGRSAAALLAGSQGALAVVSDDPAKLRTVAEWGDTSRLAASFSLHDCQALAQNLPEQVTLAGQAPACQHFQSPPCSHHACLPLVLQHKTLGLLWIECADDRLGLEGYTQLATSAGETLKLALSNIQLREALHEQAVRDALTGLYNRRHLHDIFGREFAQACRSGQPVALALLDIDHFKQVNDRYGHEAGDQALKQLAQHMRHTLRTNDICFRHGGEEFVLLLHADLAGALKCVDNLRARFHMLDFQFGEHPVCHLSFSAGVVEAPRMGATLEELLQLADAALYRAKAEGRNRVLLASAEASLPE